MHIPYVDYCSTERSLLPRAHTVPGKVLLGVITVFLCGLCIPLHAQLTSSTLAGTVYDPTGAAVPDCTVTATSLSTGAVRTTQSESSGYYTIPSLQPGQYTRRLQGTCRLTVQCNL